MKGYQSPAEHAKQVALVKASLFRVPAVAPVAEPEHDRRTAAFLRATNHIGRGSYKG